MGLFFNRKGPSAAKDIYILNFQILPLRTPSEKALFEALDKHLPGVFNKKLKKDLVKMMKDSFKVKEVLYPDFWITIPADVGNRLSSHTTYDMITINAIEGKPRSYCKCGDALRGCCGMDVNLPEDIDPSNVNYGDVHPNQYLLPSLKKGQRLLHNRHVPYTVTSEDAKHIKEVAYLSFMDDDEDGEEF